MKLNMMFKCYNEFSIAISTIIECFECIYNCKINSLVYNVRASMYEHILFVDFRFTDFTLYFIPYYMIIRAKNE